MPNIHEQKFLNALRDIFVGAKIEGDSGYINLMRIKSRYYTEGVFPKLMEKIESELQSFPGFREELFDKLYSFFKRYFSESGSIYFRHTPYHQDIYERIYTDDRDVMLFWKTQNLYYVKTDRLFRSLTLALEDNPDQKFLFDASAVAKQTFSFDASTLQNKRNNEKRSLIFEYVGLGENETLKFAVNYAQGGKKTKVDDILKAIKRDGVKVNEDQLTRAFRVFERQSEVDFFINKNAKAFLCEQFDLWMYQYLFKNDSTVWTDKRIKEMQALKRVAYSIIEFISQFEDELVRIWNKPKFALSSNYVITFDKVFERNEDLAEKLLTHEGMTAQIDEWQQLGIVEDDFTTEKIFEVEIKNGELPFTEDSADSRLSTLNSRLRFLPFDTKHFKSLEFEILALFDNLDEELDGRLIHSENYQALNTLKDKFREKVKCIHIDPPYNTATSGFEYENNYKHASWLSMMYNRIDSSMNLLDIDGSFLCHIDENEYERLQLIFEQSNLPNAGTVVWDKRNPMTASKGVAIQHEYIIWRSKQETPFYLQNSSILSILSQSKAIIKKYGAFSDEAKKEFSNWVNKNDELSGGEKAYHYLDENGRVYQSVSLRAPEPREDEKFHKPLIHPITKKPCPVPPNGFSRTPETLKAMIKNGEILFGKDETIQPRQKKFLTQETRRQITSVIQDAKKGKADLDPMKLDFPYCHPTSLYETLIGTTLKQNDFVIDFFAGSGTTAHAVINLNREDGGQRKYILVEANDYFHTVILPRVKKVVFSDKWKNGTAQADGTGVSHFCKYFALEQYEDTLRRAIYLDDSQTDSPSFFDNPFENPFASYVFLRDKKMADALDIDKQANKISVDFTKLYDEIDLAETLSCVKGKFIKSVTADSVTFEDDETIRFDEIDYRDILPLLWWDK